MAKHIIVKCGDEDRPSFWGFVFDDPKAARFFKLGTCFGKPAYRKLSNTYGDVAHLVDCRGCNYPGLGCRACPKPDEVFERERLNEHLQEDI